MLDLINTMSSSVIATRNQPEEKHFNSNQLTGKQGVICVIDNLAHTGYFSA